MSSVKLWEVPLMWLQDKQQWSTCLLQSNTSWDFLLIWFWLIWESSIAVMNLQRIITTICSFSQIHSFSFISPSSSSNSTVLTHTQHLQLWFHLQPAANFSKKVLNFLCTLTFTAPKIKQTQLPPAFEHSGAFSSSTDRNVPQEKVQRAEWEHMLDFCSPHGQKHDF